MAKKKEAEAVAEETDMEVVNLDEEERAETDEERDEKQGLHEIESEVEVEETEQEEEEVEEEPAAPSSTDTTKALLEGFKMLQEELRSRGETPPPLPVKTPEESDEDFDKRLNEELFKDDPSKVLKSAVRREARKLVETEFGPAIGSLMESAYENVEFRLRNDKRDGPIYEKYEKEVKTLLKTLTPAQQKNPAMLKAAFERVKSLHVDEIADMIVEQKMKEKVVPAASKPPVRRAPVSEGLGTVRNAPAARGEEQPSGRQVRIPKVELDAIKARAGQLGIDWKELAARWKPTARKA